METNEEQTSKVRCCEFHLIPTYHLNPTYFFVNLNTKLYGTATEISCLICPGESVSVFTGSVW